MNKIGHWTYDGGEFDVNEYFGFIYIITNKTSGKKYLGRKFFHVHQKKKRVRESPWRSYTGSCKPLNADIKELGKSNFTFEIFRLYKTRGGLSYFETYHLAVNDVLTQRDEAGERTWYNNCIGAVKWITPFEASEATRFKMSESHTKRYEDPEERLKTGASIKAALRDPEVLAAGCKARSDSLKNPEVRAKISEGLKGKTAGMKHYRADVTIYDFKHKDGRTVSATRIALCDTYELQPSNLTNVINGKAKTHKGWSLIK